VASEPAETADDIKAWFGRVLAEPETLQAVTRTARRFGIPACLEDDLLQDWAESVLSTFRRHGDDPQRRARWGTEPDARAYVFRALQNRAIDFARARRRRREVDLDVDDERESFLVTVSDDDDNVPTAAVPRARPYDAAAQRDWYRRATAAVTDVLTQGEVRCAKCRPEVVAAVVLHLLATSVAEGTVPEPSWGKQSLTGGATTVDKTLYEALDRAVPGSVELADGRVTPASRQRKNRCGKCALELLELVMDEPRSRDGD
jgi:DNA-directed RNA polymerase specialized sigma24 family protein